MGAKFVAEQAIGKYIIVKSLPEKERNLQSRGVFEVVSADAALGIKEGDRVIIDVGWGMSRLTLLGDGHVAVRRDAIAVRGRTEEMEDEA